LKMPVYVPPARRHANSHAHGAASPISAPSVWQVKLLLPTSEGGGGEEEEEEEPLDSCLQLLFKEGERWVRVVLESVQALIYLTLPNHHFAVPISLKYPAARRVSRSGRTPFLGLHDLRCGGKRLTHTVHDHDDGRRPGGDFSKCHVPLTHAVKRAFCIHLPRNCVHFQHVICCASNTHAHLRTPHFCCAALLPPPPC